MAALERIVSHTCSLQNHGRLLGCKKRKGRRSFVWLGQPAPAIRKPRKKQSTQSYIRKVKKFQSAVVTAKPLRLIFRRPWLRIIQLRTLQPPEASNEPGTGSPSALQLEGHVTLRTVPFGDDALWHRGCLHAQAFPATLLVCVGCDGYAVSFRFEGYICAAWTAFSLASANARTHEMSINQMMFYLRELFSALLMPTYALLSGPV